MKHLRKIMCCAIFLTIGELSYSAQNRHALTDMEQVAVDALTNMEQVALAERKIESDLAENLDTKSAYINYIIRKFPQYEEAFNIIIQNRKLPENQDGASILTKKRTLPQGQDDVSMPTKKRILPQGQENISTSKTNQSPFERYLSKYIPENVDDFDAPELISQIEKTIAAAMKPTVMAALQKYNPDFIHNFNLASVHTMKDLSPTKPFDNIIHDPNPIIQYVKKYSDTKLQSTTPGMQSNSAFMQPIINEWIREWIVTTPDQNGMNEWNNFHFNKVGNTLLHKAVDFIYHIKLLNKSYYLSEEIRKHADITRINLIKLLIYSGANINSLNSQGETPLSIAINQNKSKLIKMHEINNFQDNKNIIQFLIAAGANLDIQDSHGKTALMTVIDQYNIELVQNLINAKADLNIQDSNGNTALIRVVNLSNQKVNFMQQINQQDDHAEAKKIDPRLLIIADALINAKADLNLQNNDGKTAADCATSPEMRALFNLPPLQPMEQFV